MSPPLQPLHFILSQLKSYKSKSCEGEIFFGSLNIFSPNRTHLLPIKHHILDKFSLHAVLRAAKVTRNNWILLKCGMNLKVWLSTVCQRSHDDITAIGQDLLGHRFNFLLKDQILEKRLYNTVRWGPRPTLVLPIFCAKPHKYPRHSLEHKLK